MTVLAGSLQAVVMAAGKGSRMTDLTCSRPKCLLPLNNLPLLYYPLQLLQSAGFCEALVVVADSWRAEVARLPERCGLTIKLEVVAVPAQETELGTADSLRLLADRLTGQDVLVVSGDLVLQQADQLRRLVDLHRLHNSAFTALLSKPAFQPTGMTVPGAKATKYKRERDLVGLAGSRLALFSAEADVEDEVRLGRRVLHTVGRLAVHSNLQDNHLYIFKKWVCDYVQLDRNISTVKGELLPILVKKQFSSAKQTSDRKTILDFAPPSHRTGAGAGAGRYSCHALVTDTLCYRVNTVPAYWHCSSLLRGGAGEVVVAAGAEVGERTTLTNVTLGPGCRVEPRVRLSNCVLWDGVVVQSGAQVQDSLLCEGSRVSERSVVSCCLLGRGQATAPGDQLTQQLLLEGDRMMEV